MLNRFGWAGPPLSALAILASAILAPPVRAEEPEPAIAFEGEYIHDTVAIARGAKIGVRRADLLSLSAAVSLETLAGWDGARVFVTAIAGTGGRPNDLAGSMQGINNIEVPQNRLRVFEAWFEQDVAAIAGSLRLGFSDLNSEFYANDSAGLLLAPAFGIGSELAATGPNGPAIFPSTAATVRLRSEPWTNGYVQFAAVNAEAGVLGDHGGVRPLLSGGALLIGEVGHPGAAKFAVGGWAYTRRQDDIRADRVGGQLGRSRARGFYMLVEGPVAADRVKAFVRAGLSDGDTTPYSGGWQAGLLIDRIIRGRPESRLSAGVAQALLSSQFGANAADAGDRLRRTETQLELTFADRLASWLTVQPDLQYVRNSSRLAGQHDVLVFTLRLRAGLSRP